jgi:putative acetyltransferase
MNVRTEDIADQQLVRKIHLGSFPDETEANLVDALRADGDAEISLVAIVKDEIVGHVLCSRMQALFQALGLAPVAVLPEYRNQGVAAQLIRAAIKTAKSKDWDGIFLLGDPAYYQRFGFSVADAANFQSPYAGPYLMVLSVKGDVLPAQSGVIEYASAFNQLG